MEERPREGETYDFRRYDRLWQRVAPGLEPYPDLNDTEQRLRVPRRRCLSNHGILSRLCARNS